MKGPKPSYSFAFVSTLCLITLHFGHTVQVHKENRCSNILYLYLTMLLHRDLKDSGPPSAHIHIRYRRNASYRLQDQTANQCSVQVI